MKRIMLFAVAAVMAFGMMGCDNGKKTEAAKADDGKMNISIFTIQQRQQPSADNPTYKWTDFQWRWSYR